MDAKILVVDDEPHLRDVLSELLDAEGYRVMTAFDGQDALDLMARAGTPDLVLSDVLMPRMSGLDLLSAARVLYPALPVVLMSAVTRPMMPSDVPFVAKPFDIDRLLAVVSGMLHLNRIVPVAARSVAPSPRPNATAT